MARRILWILGLGLIGISALAAATHFVKASANVDNNGNLVISWKEAGLGNGAQINYQASADASAVYACINHGKKHPSASNKETVTGVSSSDGTFSAGHNGQITASLTLTPPDPGDFSCPHGQRLVIASVTYNNVTFSDVTNNISPDLTGNCASQDGCTVTLINLP